MREGGACREEGTGEGGNRKNVGPIDGRAVLPITKLSGRALVGVLRDTRFPREKTMSEFSGGVPAGATVEGGVGPGKCGADGPKGLTVYNCYDEQ